MDIEPVTRPNVEEIEVVTAVHESRTLMEQLIHKRWTWDQATAQFNVLAKRLTAEERGGYAPAALSKRHFRRIAAGQVPTPMPWTAAVLERLFDRSLAELLGPPEGEEEWGGCDDPPCQIVPACGTEDSREAHWSRPSTVPETHADQQVYEPDTPLREEVYDVDRRTFGGVLCGGAIVGGVVLGVEAVQVRREFGEALALPTSVDDAEEWEWTVRGYACAAARAQARSQLLPRVVSDLSEVRGLVERATDASLRTRLAEIGAQLSGIAALALASAGYWADAQAFWRTAQSASSTRPRLNCFFGGRRAMMGLYGPGGTMQTLHVADHVIARADGEPSPGLAHALAARAQALALEGDRPGAERSLLDLARVFDGLGDDVRSDPSVWGWPEHMLHNARSFVHSYTGNTRDAARAQDAALALYQSSSGAGAAQVRCHQAVCMIVSGDPVHGARHAGEVFRSLDPSLRNGHLRTSISFALDKLPERARRLPAAREVRALISSSTA